MAAILALGALFVGLLPLAPPASRPVTGRLPVLASAAVLLFRQFVDEDLGCASYLVGDARRRRRRRRRPRRSRSSSTSLPRQRRACASSACSRRTRTPTTSPATGGFALEHGLPVAIHPLAEPEYPFEPLADGEVVEVGAVRDPRRCTRRATGPSTARSSSTSALVLTGDSLFVGDAARPDLAVAAREGAEDLFPRSRRLADARRRRRRSTPATSPARCAAAT